METLIIEEWEDLGKYKGLVAIKDPRLLGA